MAKEIKKEDIETLRAHSRELVKVAHLLNEACDDLDRLEPDSYFLVMPDTIEDLNWMTTHELLAESPLKFTIDRIIDCLYDTEEEES